MSPKSRSVAPSLAAVVVVVVDTMLSRSILPSSTPSTIVISLKLTRTILEPLLIILSSTSSFIRNINYVNNTRNVTKKKSITTLKAHGATTTPSTYVKRESSIIIKVKGSSSSSKKSSAAKDDDVIVIYISKATPIASPFTT
ncbi:uncharacterized protein M437DRAFT_67624 [Aureobasidium melanogenum CBS 110374]|uniref:Uncharacterized protein n=1 Tax=Aureobasidium melanogenum (strain CBS 110374) TaxID=1043003 RepID=A0A074VNY8_AURM1|nr:uncharacterized protein M437DRAFT_67624 [Aureobasidium melanogenum CBS 110374]KEQ60834.1 hypothetical protein M437DRAFT_67624 [Aureobasidium melanogenum CBS 110374]